MHTTSSQAAVGIPSRPDTYDGLGLTGTTTPSAAPSAAGSGLSRTLRAASGAALGAGSPAALGVIAAGTALALAIRLYQVLRPGYLTGITEYDDGVYFGAALRLVHGAMPYHSFVLVQPPGIVVLMAPLALLARATSSETGFAVARLLTALAGAA